MPEWKLHSLMLTCNRFKGRHTGENILKQYTECFNISNKVTHVITDNALNMIRAFNLLDEHESSDDESGELETDESQECVSVDSEESESKSEDEICAQMIMNPDETESELADC